MNLKKIIITLTASALAVLGLAAIGGLVLYRTASAQTSTPSATVQRTFAHLGKGLGGFSDEDLADALGITVEELTAAYQAANEAAIDQALAAGLITEAQAGQLRERGAAFPFGGRWSGWLSQNGIDYHALLADALGITVAELQEAYAQAFTARVDQALAGGRISQEQADLLKGRYALYNSESFQTAMQSAFESAVNQAVAAGVITQAQADQILQNSAGMWSRGFGGFGGHGFGGGFGRHGRGGGLPGIPAPSAPETTPSGDL